MPLFVAVCIDKPDSLALRMANREAHFAYLGAHPGAVTLGGPFLTEAGEMAGSLIVYDLPDLAAAKAFNAEDPYVQAGLFERVEIWPWRAAIGAIA